MTCSTAFESAPLMSKADSSPPRRASKSVRRMDCVRVPATRRSTLSPSTCPSPSLIPFGIVQIEIGHGHRIPLACGKVETRLQLLPKARAFRTPVSGSELANCCSIAKWTRRRSKRYATMSINPRCRTAFHAANPRTTEEIAVAKTLRQPPRASRSPPPPSPPCSRRTRWQFRRAEIWQGQRDLGTKQIGGTATTPTPTSATAKT